MVFERAVLPSMDKATGGFGSSGVFYVHDIMMVLGLVRCAIAIVVKDGVQVTRV